MRGILSAQHADACSIQLPNFAVQRCSNNVFAPQKKNQCGTPQKKRWFVDVCPPSKGNMFRFKRLVFQDIIILFIQVLESVAAAGAPGKGPPKETQPLWESIQVILMKLLLSWVSEVSTVWSPTKTLAGWCLVMSSREQLETIFSTKWFEQRFCNNSGWFAPTSKET